MKKVVVVPSFGKVTLTDNHYLASGGEASVYAKDNLAYKIYHDKKKMIPANKITELSKITPTNVLAPKDVILDAKNIEVGYIMQYVSNTHPLCRLFTNAFRKRNNISPDMIVNLVGKIQNTVAQIHRDGFLIVDLNEMNLLCSADFTIPYFIDVDSYQTPSYKATAIMESVRDRLVKNNKFTVNSDWFSFAIIAFTLYIGMHPYQGSHPKYKPKDWSTKRMDDGISAFNPDVSLPRTCNPFSVIPKPHREWMKAVFEKNERTIPPTVDGVIMVGVPATYDIKRVTTDFDVTTIRNYPEEILSVFSFMGVEYAVSPKHIYKYETQLPLDYTGFHVLLCGSSQMSPVVCKLSGHEITFEKLNGEAIGSTKGNGMMYRNGCIYSFYQGNLMEHSFTVIGNNTIHMARIASSVSNITTKMFDGIVVEDLLGKCHITIPYEEGKCSTIHIPELDGCRIMEAKSEGNICAVLSEAGGKYNRIVLTMSSDYTKYTLRRTDDVPYSSINFTVLNNGVCVLATPDEVEIFKGSQVKVMGNPPFDSSTKLYNGSGNVYFIDDTKICMAKMKGQAP